MANGHECARLPGLGTRRNMRARMHDDQCPKNFLPNKAARGQNEGRKPDNDPMNIGFLKVMEVNQGTGGSEHCAGDK